MSTTHTASCDCGWTGGPYKSEAVATYAQSRHSCDAQRRRDDNATRNQARLQRLAQIDRTPKPCAHPDEHGQPRHQHGTYATYTLDKCRCTDCAAASAAYERNRVRRNAYGRSNLTDANPVREHIAHLTAAGVGLKQITRHTGINGGVLSKLVYGIPGKRPPSRRILKTNATKLLALNPHDPALVADGVRVPSHGTARRLQALATLGWSINAIAARTGLERQRLDGALHGRDVLAATQRTVTAVYEQLWDTPAPRRNQRERISASRATGRAQREGWAPPLAWDEGAIDDPAATPFVDEVTSARDRMFNKGAGAVNVDSLTDCACQWGLTVQQAADRLHVSKGTVDRALDRLVRDGHDVDTLRAAFARNAIAQGHDRPSREGLGLRRSA